MPIVQKAKIKTLVLIVIVTFALLIDAITFLVPNLGALGMALHGISIFLLIFYALSRLIVIFRLSFQLKSFFTILVIGAWVILIGFWSQDSRSLSGETTQETTCAIDHLMNSQDKGYHQTCLFGYPARQYLPQAITSILIGRTLTTINMAGSIYFLVGLLLFAASCIEVLGKSKRADIITALFLALLFHFRFVNHFLFHFEQSIFPLSFGLMLAGLGLQIITRQNTWLHWGLLGIAISIAVHSYTPSLVLLGLVIPIALGISIKRKHASLGGLWMAAICVSSLVISLTYRQDLSFANTALRSAKDLITDVMHANALLIAGAPEPLVSPITHGAFIAFGFSLMVGLHGKRHAFVGWWAYAVILVAVLSKGYSYYAVDFRLHRSLVIIPPLLTGAALLIKPHMNKIAIKYVLGLLALIEASGLAYSYALVAKRPMNTHYEVIKQLQYFAQDHQQSLVVTESAAQSDNLVSLHDTAQYFLPSITVRNVSVDEIKYDNCARVSQSTNLLMMLASDKKCLRSLSNGRAYKITSSHLRESYVLWKPQAYMP